MEDVKSCGDEQLLTFEFSGRQKATLFAGLLE
jgi:hypothetical protein